MRNEAIFDLDNFNASALDRQADLRDGGISAVRSTFRMRLCAWFKTSIAAWRDGRRRHRDRALLMQLSDHHLRDIGLSRGVTGLAMRHERSTLDRI